MATSTSAIFTGSSQFSSDFQQVITRAVSIASLPMQQVQNDLTGLQTQSSELSTLNGKFTALGSALQSLDSALGTGSYSASVSDTSVASAALSGTPYTGTYQIEVGNPGAYATSMSSDGLTTVADPTAAGISDATSYSLAVGTSQFTINPNSNTLSALANAINLSGADAQATVVNIGSASFPDYRLSLQGTQLGDQPIQLTSLNGSHPNQALLTAGAKGVSASYTVNGKPSEGIQSNTPTVTISPGVSATLLGAGTTTVTVSQSTSAVSAALSNLVDAYNAAEAEIANNRGQGTGGLNGQSILMTASSALQGMFEYSTGNNGISSLESLGITSDANGVLSFDPSAFATATAGNMSQLSAFLGSSTTGGFLQSATNAINSLTDSTSGAITTEISDVQGQITKDNQTISND